MGLRYVLRWVGRLGSLRPTLLLRLSMVDLEAVVESCSEVEFVFVVGSSFEVEAASRIVDEVGAQHVSLLSQAELENCSCCPQIASADGLPVLIQDRKVAFLLLLALDSEPEACLAPVGQRSLPASMAFLPQLEHLMVL